MFSIPIVIEKYPDENQASMGTLKYVIMLYLSRKLQYVFYAWLYNKYIAFSSIIANDPAMYNGTWGPFPYKYV